MFFACRGVGVPLHEDRVDLPSLWKPETVRSTLLYILGADAASKSRFTKLAWTRVLFWQYSKMTRSSSGLSSTLHLAGMWPEGEGGVDVATADAVVEVD